MQRHDDHDREAVFWDVHRKTLQRFTCLAEANLDIVGPGGQLRVHNQEAPMRGRPELTFRYSVIDTVGGGASEIQKNIIARRKLGLPKNF